MSSLSEQQKKMKAELKARQAAFQREWNQRPEVRAARRRRLMFRLVVLMVIALLLLLIRCDCGKGAPKPAAPEQAVVDPKPIVKQVPDAGVPKKKFTNKNKPLARPGFDPQTSGLDQLIVQFNLQMNARSERLSRCFVGAERPGGLKMTMSIHQESGVISDPLIEPTGQSSQLSKEQEKCLQAVLASPRFRFENLPPSKGPRNVSKVIEF